MSLDPPTSLGTSAGRIAMLEKRTLGTDDSAETLLRYVYSNHLQSASLELDGAANIISYEEYHPYGTTAFQAKSTTINAVAKRYRYTGKERDKESGLYYHGARYYIPWLCRWTAIDPLERKYAGMSPYNYGNCNPVTFNDPSGMSGEDKITPVPYPKEKHNAGDVWYYENGKNRSEGTAMNGIDNVEIPAGSKLMFINTGKTGEKDTKWLLFGFENKNGESYSWNDKASWYTTKKGKEHDNPWYDDILNAGTRMITPAIELSGLQDFGMIKALKEEYAKYDGGIASFALHKIKAGVVETVSDIRYGGNRRSQAFLSLWMNANTSFMPGASAYSPAKWLTNKTVGYIGVGYAKTGFYLFKDDFFKLHPRMTTIGWANIRGMGFGQFDVAHRATTFVKGDIIGFGKPGVKNWKTVYFNRRIGGTDFSVGINPWTRTIFHMAPGIFK